MVLSDKEVHDSIARREAPLTFLLHGLKVSEADGSHSTEVLAQPRLVLQDLLLVRKQALNPAVGVGEREREITIVLLAQFLM